MHAQPGLQRCFQGVGCDNTPGYLQQGRITRVKRERGGGGGKDPEITRCRRRSVAVRGGEGAQGAVPGRGGVVGVRNPLCWQGGEGREGLTPAMPVEASVSAGWAQDAACDAPRPWRGSGSPHAAAARFSGCRTCPRPAGCLPPPGSVLSRPVNLSCRGRPRT